MNNTTNKTNKTNKKISFLASHNGRIRCFLKPFIGNEYVNTRIKNCAIIRLSLDFTNFTNFTNINKINNIGKVKCNLNLVYDGEIDSAESKDTYEYFTSNNIIKRDYGLLDLYLNSTQQRGGFREKIFPEIKDKEYDYKEILQMLNIRELNIQQVLTNKYIYVFYIIRHGQALHNLYKGTKEKMLKSFWTPDTPLTELGIKQATHAGRALKQILYNFNDNIEYNYIEYNSDRKIINMYYFVSDLKRTHRTLYTIISELYNALYNSLGSKQKTIDVYILPCAHEITFNKHGNCDKESKLASLAGENRMCCKSVDAKCNSINLDKPECQAVSSDTSSLVFNLNWTLYDKFYMDDFKSRAYGQKIQKINKTNKTNKTNLTYKNNSQTSKKCTDTGMIIEAIKAIGGN
jgi:broad specificity phosphatase PhoE